MCIWMYAYMYLFSNQFMTNYPKYFCTDIYFRCLSSQSETNLR